MKTYVQKTYKRKFVVGLFRIAKIEKQPKKCVNRRVDKQIVYIIRGSPFSTGGRHSDVCSQRNTSQKMILSKRNLA